MTNSKLYNEKSIESLSPLEFTRLRPGVYCGDTTYSTQLLIEILSNSIDEFRLGHGNVIKIDIKDNVITVEDEGQGFISNSFRDDGKTILEAAFSVLNTSGKYREDGTYEGTSLGTYGIGSKIANYLAHWLVVKTARDGQVEQIKFEEGEFKSRTSGKCGKDIHGTTVSWLPSEEFFTNVNINYNEFKKLCQTTVALCPGLIIKLNYEGEENEYYSKNGLNDLVDELVKGKEMIDNRLKINYANGKNKLDLILTYTSNYSLTMVPYVNTGLTEAGQHITFIKTLITREFNNFARQKKWIKEKEDNLSGEDIQAGMVILFNITTPGIAYDAQVKTRVVKIDMKEFSAPILDALRAWMGANEKETKLIIDKAIAEKKAREAAKKTKEKIREGNQKKTKALKFDTKLADCYSKDRSRCEVYVTEGDSASGTLKEARDNEFQAVMPLRGKILNVQKATLDKIQKNAEIMTMIDAFGLKIDKKTMKLTFDEDDLRYDKIIIASDADVDGAHIKNLFYTFIWNFCPKLIEEGHIYSLVPPLYRITEGKDNYIYIKNDAELAQYQEKNKDKKYEISRFKGLGEMSAEDSEKTLIDVNTRILHQITVEDIKNTDKLFEDLMGSAVTPRKEFIKENSWRATYGV